MSSAVPPSDDRSRVDAVVIGGGPAGTVAARLLASWGHSVLLLTKAIDRPRGLGESLPPSTRKLLATAGVLDDLERAGFYRTTGNTVWWGSREQRVETFEASGEVRFDRPTVEGRPPHGFFLPIPIASRRADTRARLRITAGDELLADQSIEFLPAERRTLAIDTPIAICLATYNPDSKLLARQLDSLRAQTLPD